MIPDPVAELVDLLAADTAVAAIAADRIFGGGLPAGARGEMPQAAVVLAPAGGPGRLAYNRYRKTRVLAICYGETLRQADELHRAVREVLELLTRTGSIFSVETSSDGNAELDPTTQWPTSIASYLVMSADEA